MSGELIDRHGKKYLRRRHLLRGPARFYHAMIMKRTGATIKHVPLTAHRFALEVVYLDKVQP